jgi:hypothetical protein
MSETSRRSRFQVEERLAQLLAHLGLDQAHFAARLDNDWTGLVLHRPELVTSLTLVCPGNMDATALRPLASRLLVVNDDHPTGHGVTQAMAQLPDATLLTLPGYRGFLWADVMADRPHDLGTTLLEFLARKEAARRAQWPVTLPEGAGRSGGHHLSHSRRWPAPRAPAARVSALPVGACPPPAKHPLLYHYPQRRGRGLGCRARSARPL